MGEQVCVVVLVGKVGIAEKELFEAEYESKHEVLAHAPDEFKKAEKGAGRQKYTNR